MVITRHATASGTTEDHHLTHATAFEDKDPLVLNEVSKASQHTNADSPTSSTKGVPHLDSTMDSVLEGFIPLWVITIVNNLSPVDHWRCSGQFHFHIAVCF